MSDFKNEKRPEVRGVRVTSRSAMSLIQILGSRLVHNGVAFTSDEQKRLQKAYGYQDEKLNNFMQAGADVNMMKHVSNDGIRVIAYLAKYMEPGQDPVKLLVDLLIQAGYDVNPTDVSWVTGEESEDDQNDSSDNF